MRRTRARVGAQATAVWLLFQTAAIASETRSDPIGLTSGLGAGAVALWDAATGPFGNPALLIGTTRFEALVATGLDATGSPRQSLSLAYPTSNQHAFALGFDRSRSRRLLGADSRTEWRIAGAEAVAPGLWIGGALGLRSEFETGQGEPSFGLDLGLRAAPAARSFGPQAALELGLYLQNLAAPQVLRSGILQREPRRATVAAAYTRRWSATWRTTACLGLETAADAAGAPWLGARCGWKRLEVALAARPEAWNGAIAAHLAGTRIEYAIATLGERRHSLALRCGFGTPAEERRAATQRDLEQQFAERLTRELAARQEHEIEAHRAEGQSALASTDWAAAADRFRNVLLWKPDDTVAHAGLRRAELGSMLQEADSLISRRDWWAASSHLEHAVRLFPEDSLATTRLNEVRAAVSRADRSRSEAAQQFRLGLDAFASQHYSAAIRCFDAAHALDASNALAVEFAQRSRQGLDSQVQSALQLARGRLERRDAEGARSALLSALDAAPGHPEATRLIAQADAELERQVERRLSEVRRQEERAHEDRAPTPIHTPQIASIYQRGMASYRAGDLTAAMLAWEDVARQAPHFEEVDQYLLRIYRVVGLESYTEGRLKDAIRIWSKALKLEPENPQVRRYMDQANAKLQRVQGTRGKR